MGSVRVRNWKSAERCVKAIHLKEIASKPRIFLPSWRFWLSFNQEKSLTVWFVQLIILKKYFSCWTVHAVNSSIENNCIFIFTSIKFINHKIHFVAKQQTEWKGSLLIYPAAALLSQCVEALVLQLIRTADQAVTITQFWAVALGDKVQAVSRIACAAARSRTTKGQLKSFDFCQILPASACYVLRGGAGISLKYP